MNLTETIKEHLSKRVHNNELDNDSLVQIIEHLGGYLNLRTYADYARDEKISYNGVLSRIESGKIKSMELFKVKLLIDNE